MKYVLALPVICFIIVTHSCSSTDSLTREQRKAVKAEQAKDEFLLVKALIESGSYVFTARAGQSSNGVLIHFGTPMYTMSVKDEIVKADLPYYGRFYESHYTNNPEIRFEGTHENMSIRENSKKGKITLEYNVRMPNDYFEVIMRVSSVSTVTLNVMSRNRPAMTFLGYLSILPPE